MGNNLQTTGSRLYQRIYHGKSFVCKLLTWTQRRCKCGRFLSKDESKLCKKCYKESRELYLFERRVPSEQYSLESIMDFVKVSIPRWLRNELKRGYL